MNLHSPYSKILIIPVIVSALVGAVFGFSAGLLSQTRLASLVAGQFGIPVLQTGENSGSGSSGEIAVPKSDENQVSAIQGALPSVVSIVITKELRVYQQNPFFFDPFGGLFGSPFGDQQQPPKTEKQKIGGGSGFIISQDGLILTNRHVANDTDAEYTVVLNNGKEYSARVLARHPVLDLAVIKIDAKGLPALRLANSDAVQVGQTVIAIGNALGEFQNSVTKGIISGLGRDIVAGDGGGSSEELRSVIQTDAAISPGNSGGPLINSSGAAIGINTAVSQQGQNIGFAIPINEAKRMIQSVQKTGRIVLPYLGIRTLKITDEIAKRNGLSVSYGVLVARGQQVGDLAVMPGSPADKAGIVENDIILEVDGIKLDQNEDLPSLIANHNVGDRVALKISHKGKEKVVTITLAERPQ